MLEEIERLSRENSNLVIRNKELETKLCLSEKANEQLQSQVGEERKKSQDLANELNATKQRSVEILEKVSDFFKTLKAMDCGDVTTFDGVINLIETMGRRVLKLKERSKQTVSVATQKTQKTQVFRSVGTNARALGEKKLELELEKIKQQASMAYADAKREKVLPSLLDMFRKTLDDSAVDAVIGDKDSSEAMKVKALINALNDKNNARLYDIFDSIVNNKDFEFPSFPGSEFLKKQFQSTRVSTSTTNKTESSTQTDADMRLMDMEAIRAKERDMFIECRMKLEDRIKQSDVMLKALELKNTSLLREIENKSQIISHMFVH